MTNNLILSKIDFSVDFAPSKIKVENKEVFEQAIKEYTKKYKGLIVQKDDLQGAKDARKDLNNLKNKLKERRIEIKNEFSQPLTEFEAWVKKQTTEIENAVEPIDKGIKDFEQSEMERRKEIVQETIEEMAPNFNLKVEEIPIEEHWYKTKSTITAKGNLAKKTLEEISYTMKKIQEKKEQLTANLKIIKNYATAVEIDPEPWEQRVQTGEKPAELMKLIDEAVKQKRQRLEQEEADRKAREEYEAVIKQVETVSVQVDGKSVDPETGEILTSDNTFKPSLDDLPDFEEADEDNPFPTVVAPSVGVYRLKAPADVLHEAICELQSKGILVERVE